MKPKYSRIAFFISGHGFGHGVRDSALIDALPPEVEVFLFTPLPEKFFREELHRPFRYIPCELDCGALQKDSVEVEVEATLARYLAIESGRSGAVAHFAPLLKELRIDLVIGDVAPLAFVIAKAAGIPAWALYNFTWVDIYAPYVASNPSYQPMLDRMRADYAQADVHLRIFPALRTPAPGPVEDIGMLCKTGQVRRVEFSRRFGLDPAKRWCSVYLGGFGLEGVAWERLGEFSGWEFIGLYPLKGAPGNYKYVEKDRSFHYADLTASCDLVLGKLGYGLVTGCLSMGKPVLFLGREDFDEHPMLKETVESRGQGLEVSLEAFRRLEIGEAMRTLSERTFIPMSPVAHLRILEKMGFSKL